MLPTQIVNSRSQHLWRAVLTLGSVALLGVTGALVGTGCVVVSGDDSDDYYYDDPPPSNPQPDVASVDIDVDSPDQELTTTLGEGVGIFVEYEGSGQWRVWTACDTKVSGVSCGFDLYADLPGLDLKELQELEDSDFVDVGVDSAHASFDTASDRDGFVITGQSDASLRLEVLIDGGDATEFVFWSSDGVVQSGAPTNPTLFVPIQ